MKTHLLNFANRIGDAASRTAPGRLLVSKTIELLSRIVNGESCALWYQSGVWFRSGKVGAIPIGTRLEFRKHAIQSLSSEKIHGYHELRRRWWFRHYQPSQGDFIVDVGAGMGEDAYIYSRAAGHTGRVVAIEAHPATFSALAAFVRLNHLANIETLHVAASNTRETLVISSLPDGDWQCNSIMGGASHGGAEVQAVPLDEIDVIAARPVVDFIKMNIEGAEVLALHGAERTLAKTRHICVCCHDFLGDETRTKDQVCSILEQAGFALSFTSPNSPPYERDFVYGVRLT